LFSLADPFGLDVIDQPHHLSVDVHQLSACLSEPPIGFRPLLEGFQLSRLGGDVLGPWTAAIRKDLGLMEVPLGTSAVWFSAASPEGVDGAGEQRFSFEADLCELWDVVC
jgi:hypothetical protein